MGSVSLYNEFRISGYVKVVSTDFPVAKLVERGGNNTLIIGLERP